MEAIIVGYRPYQVLLGALAQVAPDLRPVQQAAGAETYASYWGRITEREATEALEEAG